jgi:hypothetical protein
MFSKDAVINRDKIKQINEKIKWTTAIPEMVDLNQEK